MRPVMPFRVLSGTILYLLGSPVRLGALLNPARHFQNPSILLPVPNPRRRLNHHWNQLDMSRLPVETNVRTVVRINSCFLPGTFRFSGGRVRQTYLAQRGFNAFFRSRILIGL